MSAPNEPQTIERIAAGLRDFGYPDVTPEMVGEIIAALRTGGDVPHGIIGQVVESFWSVAYD